MQETFQALESRRVREALRSLRQHVQGAIDLTRIESVGTPIQKLSKTPLRPLPKVTNIQPNKIKLDDCADSTDITVTGENLEEVRHALLIHGDEVAPWTTSAKIDPSPDGRSLKAHFANLASAPPGCYNLLLIDDAGQTTVSTDAVTIHPPKASYGEPQGQPTQYGILELSPPCGKPGQQQLLVIGKGGSFTNDTVFQFHPADGIVIKASKLHGSNMELTVNIDHRAGDQVYQLTATTGKLTHSKSFSVHRNHEDWTAALAKFFGFKFEGD